MLEYALKRVFALAIPVFIVVSLPAMAQDESPEDMIFPQDADVTEYIDSWGHARSGGRAHEGTDLMAPKMTPVYAVADGEVTIMDIHGLAGRYLVITHEDGWESWYIHLNNDNPGTDDGSAPDDLTYGEGVELGAHVEQGDVVGWVGDSGNAEGSGSHTHFELHIDGAPVNPYPYLREAQANEIQAEVDETAERLISEILPNFIEGEPADVGVHTDINGVME